MQSVKRPGRLSRVKQPVFEPEPEDVEVGSAEDEFDAYDGAGTIRVICPDCARPIALLAEEDVLPEHAMCPTPWNPFGLQVCAGTGRPAAVARPADGDREAQEHDTAVLLALPQGLDWRTQPFSHVGGPGSRPVHFPQMRRSAAA
ncbi:hypothetical protein ACWD6I_10330 [Streptomyces sp. NPDC002454]|jgi:hypothetical protein|uniref:hypothetical protein n=1 Tax=Streptomyces sp. NPDC049906 TaxID=3155656 RepID=UPI0034422A02